MFLNQLLTSDPCVGGETGCVCEPVSASVNKLYFGDNLIVLRDHVKEESVDLVYLDPPFNSKEVYNVPFGEGADAQVEAFRDNWRWEEHAANAYEDVMRSNGETALVLKGFKGWLGQKNLMAYLTMMAARLLELRLALKPSGSLYIHCDPTASHYLKVLLDAIFGHQGFKNEIIWKRTSGHSDARRYGSVHDSILFYTASADVANTWNQIYQKYDADYVEQYYRYKDEDGRRFMSGDLGAAGLQGGGYDYVWKGVRRIWRLPIETMRQLDKQNKIFYTRNGIPRIKRYLDEAKGMPAQDVWTDIEALRSWHRERLKYPTQKPLALLERIIQASSNEGDIVLDPFCGCGTTIEAAEKLHRQWIGIDVTHYAVTLIEGRLHRLKVPKDSYQVVGRPTTLKDAQELFNRDRHQFQWWAAWLLGAQTYREAKRGPDGGVDGNIFFPNGPYGTGRIIISVKGGENVGIGMIRELSAVVTDQEAEMGILIMLHGPTDPMEKFAVNAGFVQKSAHGRLPKLQIMTVERLLAGEKPKLPPLPPIEFKPVTRRRDRDQLELLLPFAGANIPAPKDDIIDPRFDAQIMAAE